MPEEARSALHHAVARANRCHAIWHQGLGFGTVVGFEVDLRAVELLQASLLVQATSSMRAQGSRTNLFGESRTRSFRRSFLTGFAHRIGERLAAATQEETVDMAGRAPVRILTMPVVRRGAVVQLVQVGMDVERTHRVLGTFVQTLLLLVPLGVGLAVVGGAVIARRALRPVDQMSQAAR